MIVETREPERWTLMMEKVNHNSEDFAFMRKTASGEDNDNMDGNRA